MTRIFESLIRKVDPMFKSLNFVPNSTVSSLKNVVTLHEP